MNKYKREMGNNKTLVSHGFIEIKKYVSRKTFNKDINGYCHLRNHKKCKRCSDKHRDSPRDNQGRLINKDESGCICDGYYNVMLRIDGWSFASEYYCLNHLE